ncbi:response regulator transcription factor [Shewanella surugensis]|uniref:Response regulator transcription factor n=1 Tax=Shewanella surugensis TaxID=212020 RepID=A0ABT0LI85_9GAMM|nr:response regulator transcription factor [Shewanella surugensis]MCL1127185.1 response regulator transcription factor [Shewanella surugensis]
MIYKKNDTKNAPELPSLIRVALVDDQPLERQSLASLLSIADNIELTWQAEDGEDALNKLKRQNVDVLLCDIRMPKLDGINTLKQLRQANNNLPVIMLTTFSDYQLLIHSIASGANGFLLKDVTHNHLINAIKQVINGGYLFENDIHERLSILHKTVSEEAQQAMNISKREYEILSLMAGGFSNQDIANAIFLAEGTVKNHISALLLKLKSQGRTEAILKALELSLI